jgi:hypothetical protein
MATMMMMSGPRPMRFRDLLAQPAAAAAAAPGPSQRKDQAALTPKERQLFLDAFTTLNTYGVFGQFVAIHADMSHIMHNMHGQDPNDPTGARGQQRFLPWHRVFLYQLEQQLQATLSPSETTSIPYWNWEKAEEQGIPDWLQGVTPTVVAGPAPAQGIPSLTVSVIRSPLTSDELLRRVSGIGAVKQKTDYTDFATGLEGVHDQVHDWVGGTMGDLTTASADLLFWMHHANIDRLWWEWHQTHKDQNPNLTGLDAILDPWRYDEPMTRDIANFNYVYV